MGISDVVLVVGYKKEKITGFVKGLSFQGNIKCIENPDFTKGSILSLYRAKDELNGDVLLMDGDVYFSPEVLNRITQANQENLVAIDTTSNSSGEEMVVGIKGDRVIDMKRKLCGDYDVVGEAAGFYRFNEQACEELGVILSEQIKSGRYGLGYEDILPFLFQRFHFKPVIIDGLDWVEIDFEEDVLQAENLDRNTTA